jgi:hypothetical protein
MNMFGVNHVYNADYNTFMLFFFFTCFISAHALAPAPANIDELTFAL